VLSVLVVRIPPHYRRGRSRLPPTTLFPATPRERPLSCRNTPRPGPAGPRPRHQQPRTYGPFTSRPPLIGGPGDHRMRRVTATGGGGVCPWVGGVIARARCDITVTAGPAGLTTGPSPGASRGNRRTVAEISKPKYFPGRIPHSV